MSKHQMVIGRGELVSFPLKDIHDVPAKSDTGAYRSAVHCTNVKVIKKSNGTKVLRFVLFNNHPCATESQTIETENFNKVEISNSFGHKVKRYEVKLKIKIGPKIFISSFTLADRSKKIYPILLGRKLIRNRFLVDVSKTGVNRKLLKERYGVSFPEDEENIDED